MDSIRTLLLACALLAFTGCATTATSPNMANQTTAGQRILDKYLSPGFTGDISIQTMIPLYLTITLQGQNLRREPDGWKYDWFEYTRTGPVGTSTHIKLGKRP